MGLVNILTWRWMALPVPKGVRQLMTVKGWWGWLCPFFSLRIDKQFWLGRGRGPVGVRGVGEPNRGGVNWTMSATCMKVSQWNQLLYIVNICWLKHRKEIYMTLFYACFIEEERDLERVWNSTQVGNNRAQSLVYPASSVSQTHCPA